MIVSHQDPVRMKSVMFQRSVAAKTDQIDSHINERTVIWEC